MKERLCMWQCGRTTRNHTRICDLCWADRENIYLARKAREAAAEVNPKRQAAARKAVEKRREKRGVVNPELPRTEVSQPIDGVK